MSDMKKYLFLMNAVHNVLGKYLRAFKETPRYTLLRQRLRRALGAVGFGVCLVLGGVTNLYAHDHEQIINKLYSCSRKYVMQHGNELLSIALGNHTRALQVSTIIEPGYYEFASNVSTPLTVASSNVTLDLNGYTASGGITIAAGKQNVIITNGTVDGTNAGSNAININSGCESIKLQNLAVRNATGAGIYCDMVRDSVIQHCDLTSNATGLALDTCANIIVHNCNAIANAYSGFDLVSSITCSFVQCSALSTGQGNDNASNQFIFGFVSESGNGNLFDHCIANGTQALATTDSDSIVAGFALRGSEGCSSIINCESGNTQTNETGFTVPYGILLEATMMNELTTSISVAPGGNLAIEGKGLDWSPDGKYLAIGTKASGNASVENFFVYEFDRTAFTLTQVARLQFSATTLIRFYTPIQWHPDGVHLLIGSGFTQNLRLYAFDRNTNTLTLLSTYILTGGTYGITSLDWSACGRYVAVGYNLSVNLLWIAVLEFDPLSNKFVRSTPHLNVDTASFYPINAVWCPDGQYVAVRNPSNNTKFYLFDRANFTLTYINQSFLGSTTILYNASFSPNGKYYSWTDFDGQLQVALYNQDVPSLTALVIGSITGCLFSAWSPDGKYIAAGFSAATSGDDIRIYEFGNNGSYALTERGSIAPAGDSTVDGYQLAFSPDGTYLAIGAANVNGPGGDDDIWIYKIFDEPQNNVIQNNTVYCNSGGSIPFGIGISGSSIANLIINNTAYANPIDPQIVATNYANVQNVFNPLFEPAPSILQNLSLTNNVPINTPPDLPLLWTTAFQKCCDIATKTEFLATLIP